MRLRSHLNRNNSLRPAQAMYRPVYCLLAVHASAIDTLILDITSILLDEPSVSSPSTNSLLHLHPLLLLPSRQCRRSMDPEPEDSRLVSVGGLDWDECWINLHEDVVEGCAEVRAVDSGVAR